MKKVRNNHWWLIEAKDNSCQGYMPARSKEEACQNFGLKVNESIIKEVEWSGKEFVEINQGEQGKLF